jgi:Delta7-sterol 5-desaturase
MDIVLEIVDTFFLDRFYASFWPALPGPGVINSIQNMPNGTSWSFRDPSTASLNNFHYKSASQYISVAPSKWAYLTSWPRDDSYRQLLSLYLITWYARYMLLSSYFGF